VTINTDRLDQLSDGMRLNLIGKPVEVGVYDKNDDSLLGYVIGKLESILRTDSTVVVLAAASGGNQSHITFNTDEAYALVTYILP
jgi:hypothetical protein